MKLFVTAALIGLAVPVTSQSYFLVSDQMFDNYEVPLTNVACSTGPYGLINPNLSIIGYLATFPCIGGAPNILSGYQSPECGSCWKLTYGSTSVNFTAISSSPPGEFTVSLKCLNSLTSGDAAELGGGVWITANQISSSNCAFSA